MYNTRGRGAYTIKKLDELIDFLKDMAMENGMGYTNYLNNIGLSSSTPYLWKGTKSISINSFKILKKEFEKVGKNIDDFITK